MRAANALASLRICADSPEHSPLADVIVVAKSRELAHMFSRGRS